MCGCKERRALLGQMGRNLLAGKPIAPQVKRFNDTVRQDIAAMKRMVLAPRVPRGR